MKLVSVILSGGAGRRLWPVSRQTLPKPFMKLGGSSLLQQAIGFGYVEIEKVGRNTQKAIHFPCLDNIDISSFAKDIVSPILAQTSWF